MDIQFKKRGFLSDEDKSKVDSLVSLSTELVLCLMEGNNRESEINKIMISVNFDFLK